jgi:hypothetical protein
VNDVLYNQINEEVRSSYLKQLAAKDKEHREESNKMKAQFQESARREAEKKFNTQFIAMQKELNKKSNELKEMNKLKAETEKLKREKNEVESKVRAELAKKMREEINQVTDNIKKRTEANSERKIAEKELVIKGLVKQLTEMKRKAEQGSIQTQGEAQEICIEDWLTKEFPDDEITEVKKGVKGADCVHNVCRDGNNCGKILVESKRTNRFSKKWIGKLKSDMRREKAEIGIIITEALPEGNDGIQQTDGIWVCSYMYFKIFCPVLREFVIDIYEATSMSTNKDEKITLVYDYLTGNEFKMHMMDIANNLKGMIKELDKDKKDAQNSWKRREKQIRSIFENSGMIYKTIKDIAGKSLPNVKGLELPPA